MTERSFTLTGTKAMAKKMRELAERVPKKFGQQLRLQAELIITDAKQNYVPKKLGTLRDSGLVSGPFIDGQGRDALSRFTLSSGGVAGSIEVSMTFGGAASAYARAIHEHPSSSSPLSWKGKTLKFQGGRQRGVKYLERPMRFHSIGMAGRIARGVLPL